MFFNFLVLGRERYCRFVVDNLTLGCTIVMVLIGSASVSTMLLAHPNLRPITNLLPRVYGEPHCTPCRVILPERPISRFQQDCRRFARATHPARPAYPRRLLRPVVPLVGVGRLHVAGL